MCYDFDNSEFRGADKIRKVSLSLLGDAINQLEKKVKRCEDFPKITTGL